MPAGLKRGACEQAARGSERVGHEATLLPCTGCHLQQSTGLVAAPDPRLPPGEEGARAAAAPCPAPSCPARSNLLGQLDMKAVAAGRQAGEELAFSVKSCSFCLGRVDSQRGAA